MSKIINNGKYRRFGVEIELNTSTNILKHKTEVPDGAEQVAKIIQSVTPELVTLNGWHYTNNNSAWVIKPDGSCGMELCSPVLKGRYDLAKLTKIVQLLSEDLSITSDKRCSFHVHVNLEDMSREQIGNIMAWWIKCEPVFFDSLPGYRKCSRHTQLIGMSNIFQHDVYYYSHDIIDLLSDVKYYSINAYHMRVGRRRSLEFRIAENSACLDPIFVKNWIQLLLLFVEKTHRSMPPKIKHPINSNMGLFWLDPNEVFQLLGFNSPNKLTEALKQVRSWFLKRLLMNSNAPHSGIWQEGTRTRAIEQIVAMASKEKRGHVEDYNTLLYNPSYIL